MKIIAKVEWNNLPINLVKKRLYECEYEDTEFKSLSEYNMLNLLVKLWNKGDDTQFEIMWLSYLHKWYEHM